VKGNPSGGIPLVPAVTVCGLYEELATWLYTCGNGWRRGGNIAGKLDGSRILIAEYPKVCLSEGCQPV